MTRKLLVVVAVAALIAPILIRVLGATPPYGRHDLLAVSAVIAILGVSSAVIAIMWIRRD